MILSEYEMLYSYKILDCMITQEQTLCKKQNDVNKRFQAEDTTNYSMSKSASVFSRTNFISKHLTKKLFISNKIFW